MTRNAMFLEHITNTFSNNEMTKKEALKTVYNIYNEVYEVKPKPISQYNIFIREQMKILKDNNSELKNKEKMSYISNLWKQKKESL